jgi:hypothetical protein
MRYELGFYIPEDGILHSHRRENLKSYNAIGLLGIIRKFLDCPSPDELSIID